MRRRVALVGMNNPTSSREAHALWPSPSRSTGARLWELLHARTGASQEDYLRAFDRYNLHTGRLFSIVKARQGWRTLHPMLIERYDTIVLLGGAVQRAAGLSCGSVYMSSSLICIPHPSGLNRWYNSPANRAVVEIILEELYTDVVSGVWSGHADVPSVPELSPLDPRP